MPRLIDADKLAEKLEGRIRFWGMPYECGAQVSSHDQATGTAYSHAKWLVEDSPTVEPEPAPGVDAAALIAWLEERVSWHEDERRAAEAQCLMLSQDLLRIKGYEADDILDHVRNTMAKPAEEASVGEKLSPSQEAAADIAAHIPKVEEARVLPFTNGNYRWTVFFRPLQSEPEFPTFADAMADLGRYLEALRNGETT